MDELCFDPAMDLVRLLGLDQIEPLSGFGDTIRPGDVVLVHLEQKEVRSGEWVEQSVTGPVRITHWVDVPGIRSMMYSRELSPRPGFGVTSFQWFAPEGCFPEFRRIFELVTA